MEGFAFALGMVVSAVIALAFIRWMVGPVPIERSNPRHIFRLVERDDRAAYVRIMRGTLAVQMRDMSRAMTKAMREIGKALLPAIQRVTDALDKAFR